MKNIVLIGVQGSGKGTVAKQLVDKYNYIHISTGDLLRDKAKDNDELGKEVKNLIDNGLFVSDELLLEIIKEKITNIDGYILDGYPRNLKQAEDYQKLLNELNKDIGIVINLNASRELIEKRVLGRRMCKDCGAIYNIYSKELAPIVENKCNKCNGSLYQRADDNKESLDKRVETYYAVTQQVLGYYKELGVLKTIDVTEESTVDSTFQEVSNLL